LDLSRDELGHAGSIFDGFVGLGNLCESLGFGFAVLLHDDLRKLVLVLLDQVVDLEENLYSSFDSKLAPFGESGIAGGHSSVNIDLVGQSDLSLSFPGQRGSNRQVLSTMRCHELVVDPVVDFGEVSHG
jgi:hypothetical protein